MSSEKGRKPRKSDIVRELPMTAEEYLSMPNDGNRYELADGRLELMSPGPERDHQIIIRQLSHLLSRDCASEYEIVMAPVDVILSPEEVRQPDLVMIHLSRMSIYRKRGSIESPPDLVVEVLSPTSRKRDKVVKRSSYARFGVPEYWIINPADGTLEQYLLTEAGAYDLTDVYDGAEPIQSEKLVCLSFTMEDIMSRVRHLPEV